MTEYFGGQREGEPCPCLPVEFRLRIRIEFSVRQLPRFGCFCSVSVHCPHEPSSHTSLEDSQPCAEASGRWLVSTLMSPLGPKQIAETLTAKSAGRDHPIMRNDPTATAPSSGAADLTTPCQPRQNLVA